MPASRVGGVASSRGRRWAWCAPCRRIWNRWNAVCPKCGRDTIPEAEMPEPPKADFPSECAAIAMA